MGNTYVPGQDNKIRQTPFPSIQGNNLTNDEILRVLPRQLSTGSTRGTQTVGYGNTKIDGSNNRIIIANPVDNTSVGIGTIPGTTNEFGFFSLDANGNVVMKIVNGNWYLYDVATGKNVLQMGKLPDASYGMAAAATGKNVADGF